MAEKFSRKTQTIEKRLVETHQSRFSALLVSEIVVIVNSVYTNKAQKFQNHIADCCELIIYL